MFQLGDRVRLSRVGLNSYGEFGDGEIIFLLNPCQLSHEFTVRFDVKSTMLHRGAREREETVTFEDEERCLYVSSRDIEKINPYDDGLDNWE